MRDRTLTLIGSLIVAIAALCFAPGFDTADLKDAKALLNQLAP